MKVLKDGEHGPPEDWSEELTCKKRDKYDKKGCGAVLQVTFEDLVMMYWHGTHFPHYYSAVKCPQCGKYNATKNLPNPLWVKFNTKARRRKAVFDGFSDSIY